jgi:hypothetical protein
LKVEDNWIFLPKAGWARVPLQSLWRPWLLVPCPELIETRVQRVQAESSQQKDSQYRA